MAENQGSDEARWHGPCLSNLCLMAGGEVEGTKGYSTTPLPPPFDMGNGREARCSPQDQMGVSYPVKQ